MVDTLSARLQDGAGRVRPANLGSPPAGLSPEETEAADRALQHALAIVPTGSGSPYARLKPMHGANAPSHARPAARPAWGRLGGQQVLAGVLVLVVALTAATLAIVSAGN